MMRGNGVGRRGMVVVGEQWRDEEKGAWDSGNVEGRRKKCKEESQEGN